MFCFVAEVFVASGKVTRSRCALISKHPDSLTANVLDFKNNNQADVFKNLRKTFRL